MARTAARPQPTRHEHLQPWFAHGTACGQRLGADYKNRRTVATRAGLTPEIHQALHRPGLDIAQRTVTNLLDRYDELLAGTPTADRRLHSLLAEHGRVLLALDGLQPDVGHEVLWVLPDCISGEVVLAKSLLCARPQDLAELRGQVRDGLTVPIVGVVSDGQHSLRKQREALRRQMESRRQRRLQRRRFRRDPQA